MIKISAELWFWIGDGSCTGDQTLSMVWHWGRYTWPSKDPQAFILCLQRTKGNVLWLQSPNYTLVTSTIRLSIRPSSASYCTNDFVFALAYSVLFHNDHCVAVNEMLSIKDTNERCTVTSVDFTSTYRPDLQLVCSHYVTWTDEILISWKADWNACKINMIWGIFGVCFNFSAFCFFVEGYFGKKCIRQQKRLD